VSEQFSHYVYTLAYPESMGGRVFYIGKGMNRRINHHEQEARRGIETHKCRIIRKIWTSGEQIVKTKVAHFETDKEACMYEVALIFFMDGLTNETDGGEGVRGLSEEGRRKMSEATKRQMLSEERRRKLSEARKGIRLSDETRRKISEAQKGRIGKPHSEEARRKMSVTRKGRSPSEEARQRMSNAQKGKRYTEEDRHKMSEARKGKPGKKPSEETRRKMSQSHMGNQSAKGRIFTAEMRKSISDTQKANPRVVHHLQKMGAERKGKPGKPLSEEHKRNISNARQRQIAEDTQPRKEAKEQ
jgi:hypothetical protein